MNKAFKAKGVRTCLLLTQVGSRTVNGEEIIDFIKRIPIPGTFKVNGVPGKGTSNHFKQNL